MSPTTEAKSLEANSPTRECRKVWKVGTVLAIGFSLGLLVGVGMLIGSWVSGPVVDRYARQAGEAVTHDWTAIWLWPASMAFVIILLFAFFFDGGKGEQKVAA